MQHESPRENDPLPLSARYLARFAVGQTARKTDAVKRFGDITSSLRA